MEELKKLLVQLKARRVTLDDFKETPITLGKQYELDNCILKVQARILNLL